MRARTLPVTVLALLAALACGACAPWIGYAGTPPPRPLTLVAIGASDTVGVGATTPETEGWVPVLHRQLPEGSRLVNVGVSGSLLRQALDQQLPVALDSDPDVVTVWLAVNDLNARVPLDRYRVELDTLLRTLRRETRARVLVGNVPDITTVPIYRSLDPATLRAEVAAWNQVIAVVAARNEATLVDLHATWKELAAHPEYVAADGFHPSTAGHRRLADVFLTAIPQAGRGPTVMRE